MAEIQLRLHVEGNYSQALNPNAQWATDSLNIMKNGEHYWLFSAGRHWLLLADSVEKVAPPCLAFGKNPRIGQ